MQYSFIMQRSKLNKQIILIKLVWKCFLKSLLKTAPQDLRLREEVGEAFEQRQSRRKGLLFGGRGPGLLCVGTDFYQNVEY